MGYSRNVKAIDRVRPLLEQMLVARTNLMWPSKNAHMLGYHIREALTIAKKEKIEPFDKLKERFVIRNKGDHVVAELKDIEELDTIQSVMSRVTLEGLVTLMEIVGGAINHKADQMFFPSADLEDGEVEKLYIWAQKNSYFLIVADSGVTLSKSDPGEAKWEPK